MAASSLLPIQKRTLALGAQPEVSKQSDSCIDGCTPSTWAGGGSAASHGSDEWTPTNWRIRNTFLEMPLMKPTAIQDFQRSRRSWSCPAGGREAAEREEFAVVWPVQELEDIEEAPQPKLMRAVTMAATHIDPEEQEEDIPRPTLSRALTTPPERHSEAPRPLALAELVGPQSHSKGSELHFQGACKPCAFFWKAIGCNYGSACEFCHLCDSEERKRRNKEKRMAMHTMQSGVRQPDTTASEWRTSGMTPVRPSRGSRRVARGGA